MLRITAALAFLCLASTAHAYDCNDIKQIVKLVGEKKAIRIAREAGATEEQIRVAAECLKHK